MCTGRVSAVADSPPMNENEILYAELSHAIVGAAMTVSNGLRPGLNEKAYENALVIEFGRTGLKVDQQRRFDVRYRGVLIDTLIPDLIVNDRVIVDPKVAKEFTQSMSAR